jgi:MFS family permease
MLPGIAYYMSRWYRRSELAFRLSMYIVMAPLAGAFGGLLASGILTLDSVGSLTTWRMIFIIEGIITCGLSLIAFFTLTDRPSSAKWLTAEEKELAIARIKSERVGTTEVLDKMDKKKLLAGIFNPVVLGTSFIFLLDNITVQGLAFFLPTIVRVSYCKQDDNIPKTNQLTRFQRQSILLPFTRSCTSNSAPSRRTSSAPSSPSYSHTSQHASTNAKSSSSAQLP